MSDNFAKENEKFREQLKDIPATAFQGHTEFQRLTPEQKLTWLSGAVRFYFENAKREP